MRLFTILVGLLITLNPVAAYGQVRPVFVHRVNYVDVANGRVIQDQSVMLVADTVILIPKGEEHPPSGVRIISGRGKHLMPSLYDMHVHLMTGRLSAHRAMALAVANGVTGMRDMGGYVDSMVVLRKRIAVDSTLPRVWFAGPLIDGPKHRWSHGFAWHVTDAKSATAAFDSLRGLRVDFIKVYGGIPADAYYALATRARAEGVTFGGHIPSSVSTSAAARAGQRTFEHATMDMFAECVTDGNAMVRNTLNAWVSNGYSGRFAELEKFRAARRDATCRSMMQTLAETGAYVVPTMVNELKDSSNLTSRGFEYLPKGLQDACRSTIEMIVAAPAASRNSVYQSFRHDVKALRAAGVRLMVGTDIPNACLIPGYSVHDELKQLVDAGLTPAEALRAATTTPRSFFGVKDNDVVLLDGNPLNDIGNTARIAGVFMRGRWLDRDTLQNKLTAPLSR
jgi:hypothetical protein